MLLDLVVITHHYYLKSIRSKLNLSSLFYTKKDKYNLSIYIKNIFGFKPKNIFLYKLAFTHVSATTIAPNGKKINNERLEYLGDAILGAIIADYLYKKYPNVDEGFLTDGVGRKIDFKNTIIIATSNAGYQLILQAIKENLNWEDLRQKMLDYLFEKGTFRPEFINRFDATVIFKPLTQENLMDISALMLGKIQRGLKSKGMDLIITNELKRKIAELGYDPKFGARQMKRVVQDKVENELASALLSNRLTRGNRVEVNPDDFSLKISRI